MKCVCWFDATRHSAVIILTSNNFHKLRISIRAYANSIEERVKEWKRKLKKRNWMEKGLIFLIWHLKPMPFHNSNKIVPTSLKRSHYEYHAIKLAGERWMEKQHWKENLEVWQPSIKRKTQRIYQFLCINFIFMFCFVFVFVFVSSLLLLNFLLYVCVVFSRYNTS